MGCARPPCIRISRRFRRRGPRSSDALLRRRHRRDFDVSLILPQGGDPCKYGPDPFCSMLMLPFFIVTYVVLVRVNPELETRLMIMEKKKRVLSV